MTTTAKAGVDSNEKKPLESLRVSFTLLIKCFLVIHYFTYNDVIKRCVGLRFSSMYYLAIIYL